MQKEILALKEELEAKDELSKELRMSDEEKSKRLKDLLEKQLYARMMPPQNQGGFNTVIVRYMYS